MTSSYPTPLPRFNGGTSFTHTIRTAIVSVLCCLVAAAMAFAEPSSSLTHQGRLTDGSGTPLNGVYTLTFRLYTAEFGSPPIASEVRSVNVLDGLFAVSLDTIGGASMYSDNDGRNENWYFGISVGADAELLPRLRIGTVPFAHVASGLDGSIDKDGNGTADIGSLVESKETRNTLKTFFETGDVPTQSQFTVLLDSDGSSIRVEARDQFNNRQSSSTQLHKPDSMSLVHVLDSDGDGLDDAEISSAITASTAVIKTKTKSNQSNDRTSVEITSGGNAPTEGSSILMTDDSDGDGLDDAEISSVVTASTAVVKTKTKSNQSNDRSSVTISTGSDAPNQGSSIVLSDDSDGDNVPEGEIESIVTPTKSSVAINTKGTGADKGRVISTTYPDSASQDISSLSGSKSASLQVSASPGGSRSAMLFDDDNDNDPEGEIESIVTPTVNSVAIKTKGTGADANRVITTTTPDSVSHELIYDSDQPGSELTVSHKTSSGQLAGKKRFAATSPTDTTVSDEFLTPDSLIETVSSSGSGGGGGGSSYSYTAKTGKSGKTKRSEVIDPSSSSSSRVAQTVDSFTEEIEVLDGGGGAGGTFLYGAKAGKTGRAKRSETFTASARSLNVDSQTPDSIIEQSTFYSGGVVKLDYKAKQGNVGSAKRCAFTGPSSSSDIDEDCDDLNSAMRMSHSSSGDVHSTDVSCDAARSSMEFSSSNLIGTGTALTLQTDVGGVLNPIEHSSGAHLTAGGTWTNSSDKNLKENFENVNGEEILEKVAELPIKRWNYKTENDEVTHIGPTAQDFKEAFNVGGNDKSISTIDPSGVALVAIKELKKENDQLRKELNELRKMIEKMKK